jgi:acetyltransferase-like isoleucine patch superfamily enzyme
MAYLADKEARSMGFRYLGNNVKISDKASIYSPGKISIGDNSRIDDFCVLSEEITIGRNVHIAVFCNVAGGSQGVTFDDFSGLAYGVNVFSQSDDYSGRTLTNPTVPEEFKDIGRGPVLLGRHVIIGAGSIVFPGVTVADGCAVGAMSLVNRSTQEWGIYSGIPAKRIKDRSRELLDLEMKYLSQR